jgi:glutathione S-transferase kappa 1
MATHRLTFFYDCLSPFSCFANVVIKRYAKVWPIEVQYRPFLLGGVMAATKNVPPAARPWAKFTQQIGAQDMKRNHAYYNCHLLRLATNFFGPDGPADKRGLARDMRYMRLLTAIRLEHPAALPSATEKLFEIIHIGEQYRDSQGNVLMTEDLLETVCTSAGISVDAAHHLVHDRINADDVKIELKNAVADAVEQGAYGSPTIVITPLDGVSESQSYFGADRFEQLAFTNGWAWAGPDPSRPMSRI